MSYQTITAFARRFGLSRGTLLYYDRIGLLKPAGTSVAGYRLYGERESRRMVRIERFRQAGLSLRVIRELLDGAQADQVNSALERRLAELDDEIAQLRVQKRLVVELLRRQGRTAGGSGVDVRQWVAMLAEAGVDEAGQWRWHAAFERDNPGAHQAFLESLGLPQEEVADIRRRSRTVSSDTRAHPAGPGSTRAARRAE